MVARPLPPDLTARVVFLDVLARQFLETGRPWRVHSVFAHACNLTDISGTLLGIVSAEAGNAPATLMLRAGEPASPLNKLLARGDPARPVGDTLQIGALRLDLAGAVLWSPAPIVRTLRVPEVEARLALAATFATTLAPAGGLAPLLPDAISLATGRAPGAADQPAADRIVCRARELVSTLAGAIREQRWSDAYAPARALSGLGPGLTPSGDDLLAGLALGLRAARGSLPEPLAESVSSAINGRTTDLAAARVRHAVAGHPDERVHQLLGALVTHAEIDLAATVRALLAYGHSSGADTLVGLLVGVSLGLRAAA